MNNDDNFFESDKYAEDRELFKRALLESIADKASREIKDAEKEKHATLSKEDKAEMNRFYKEVIGGSKVLYPEVEGLSVIPKSQTFPED